MSYFGSFSPRARRTIFLAHCVAKKEGADEITPEHILSALLREDPALFAIVMPQNPNPANDLKELLAPDGSVQTQGKHNREHPPLSVSAKEVVFVSSEVRKRLGHSSVGTQHLLLALLLTPRARLTWLRHSYQQQNSRAKQILMNYGLTAASVEARIKEGIVTPLTWVLDDSIIKLNAQLTALTELLISKGVFKRSDFVAMLDQNPDSDKPSDFLVALIDALSKKGALTASEQSAVTSIGSPTSSNERPRRTCE
jgi:ATP-dependent Clp protease ATP-binding subunit ClpA